MTDLSPERLASLRDTALNATPGPWKQVDDQPSAIARPNGGPYLAEVFSRAEDAAHIATFDPETVLALLDLIQAQADTIQRVETAAIELDAYDCTTDVVPDGVDVPDDYEMGMNDAAARLRAALGGDAR